jgi:2-polyprenyl-3-methyl-5-hydroxy-6-metoxy-1,4-benzoquinol methylase
MSVQPQDKQGLLSPALARWRLGKVQAHIAPGSRVLDCGCGSGRLCTMLPEECSYVGVDLDVSRVPQQLRSRATFISGDLTRAEDRERVRPLGPFDVIVAASLLEHLAEPAEMLSGLAPQLSADGRFVITTPSPGIRRLHQFGGRLGIFSRHAAAEHEVLLDREGLLCVAGKANLEVVVYETFQWGLNQLAVLQPAKGSTEG